MKRYFYMIAFVAYLDAHSPNSVEVDLQPFHDWMDNHKEFQTMLEDMEKSGIDALVPVEHLSPGTLFLNFF
jgi:hypothetical protein